MVFLKEEKYVVKEVSRGQRVQAFQSKNPELELSQIDHDRRESEVVFK